MMRRYVYISTSAGLPEAEVEKILASSRRNNALNNLTGFLLYNGRNFFQLIEGETASLMALMVRLSSDSRHSGIVRLQDIAIEERCAPEWEMARLNLAQDSAQRAAIVEGQLPTTLDDEARKMVVNFASLQ